MRSIPAGLFIGEVGKSRRVVADEERRKGEKMLGGCSEPVIGYVAVALIAE